MIRLAGLVALHRLGGLIVLLRQIEQFLSQPIVGKITRKPTKVLGTQPGFFGIHANAPVVLVRGTLRAPETLPPGTGSIKSGRLDAGCAKLRTNQAR